jgi:hypothetical protein
MSPRQHVVDEQRAGGDRLVEARPIRFVTSSAMSVGDDDARLVQHDMAEPTPSRGRRRRWRSGARSIDGRAWRAGEFAGRDHLGEHHRGRLQRLDLFLGIGAVRAVLHDQHAERVAGAQDRHAEEGVVDLLAGLRQVGEGRMALRVRQVERARLGGDQADQALADPQRGLVDGFAVEALGGVELERAVTRST